MNRWGLKQRHRPPPGGPLTAGGLLFTRHPAFVPPFPSRL